MEGDLTIMTCIVIHEADLDQGHLIHIEVAQGHQVLIEEVCHLQDHLCQEEDFGPDQGLVLLVLEVHLGFQEEGLGHLIIPEIGQGQEVEV